MKIAAYTHGIGAAEHIGYSTDSEFDPEQKAFYYARAIEIPTPRWTFYGSVNYTHQNG